MQHVFFAQPKFDSSVEKPVSLLNSSLLLIDLPDDANVKFLLAGVGVQAIDLLLDVIELGIAETTDLRVAEHGLCQAAIPVKELLGCGGSRQPSPRSSAQRIPPYSLMKMG